ncbi:MAG TPA: STAS domain-containing protein [Armatimonadota bacterium]|jgi:anti-anti-sigma factor
MDQDVLDISTQDDGGITIVSLTGELDSMNVGDMTHTFSGLLDDGKRLFVLDLSGLEFIDSAGLGGLVSLWERSMERGCFLALGAQSPRVKEVLQITGLNTVLQPHESMEAASASVRAMEAAFPPKS